MKTLWRDNNVQFARLLAEIRGIGLSDRQMHYLREVMDLEDSEINELLERAEVEFQKIKEKL